MFYIKTALPLEKIPPLSQQPPFKNWDSIKPFSFPSRMGGRCTLWESYKTLGSGERNLSKSKIYIPQQNLKYLSSNAVTIFRVPSLGFRLLLACIDPGVNEQTEANKFTLICNIHQANHNIPHSSGFPHRCWLLQVWTEECEKVFRGGFWK